jgi:restriction system protein
MSRRYSAIIRTLAREVHEAAKRTKAERLEAIVEQQKKYLEQDLKLLRGPPREEYFRILYTRHLPGSSESLNKKLDQRIDELTNILPTSLSATSLIGLPFLTKSEPMGAVIQEVVERNRQIGELIKALEQGEADAVSSYFELVLRCSIYPDGFHENPRIAYINESRLLIVDYQLPTVDEIVPTVERYKPVKATGGTIAIKKKERDRRQIYENVVASTVLRILREIFLADQYNYVQIATINAFVETIDRGTGHQIRPYLLSVRGLRDEFERLNLQQVDPFACLKRLTAAVSRSPAELVPIKPIVDINMFDPRFVEGQNIIAGLDNRTNLMTLTPNEFEILITNLFQRMGLETKLTRPSRDGGVDCVAFDQRPILGGKVVVQAKRYQDTVGVGSYVICLEQ